MFVSAHDKASAVKPVTHHGHFLSGRQHPKSVVFKIKNQVKKELLLNPSLTLDDLTTKIGAGRHGVYNTLKHLNIPTIPADRLSWANRYKPAGRLIETVKTQILADITSNTHTISELARDYGVARKTIYSWLTHGCPERYRRGPNHPRSTSPEAEQAILVAVNSNPSASIHTLAQSIGKSSHGVWSILKKHGLTNVWARQEFAKRRLITPQPQTNHAPFQLREHLVTEQFVPNLAPAPPPHHSPSFSPSDWFKTIGVSCGLTVFVVLGSGLWLRVLVNSGNQNTLGFICASLALAAGMFFLAYSFKYYLTIALVLSYSQSDQTVSINSSGFWAWLLGRHNSQTTPTTQSHGAGLSSSIHNVVLTNHPMISIHIPLYNEKNVALRSLHAAIAMDYPEYEVIMADDSTDATVTLIDQEMATHGPVQLLTGEGWTLATVQVRPGLLLKHLHRTSRSGFKGGALRLASRMMDPRVEFISVFDADFAPYSDTLDSFVKYFKVANNGSEAYQESRIAAVQGYQWHVLNKSENWVTRGVRTEYSGSYVIERAGTELYGGLKQISGSVYMLRRDALEQVGWGNSITEDFELTLRLYAQGFKVVYTPYIQSPAECVSTVKRLIPQRMRWAEGHSFNVRRMFAKLIFSPDLTTTEKAEFVYLVPYYLQAAFFLVGTLGWLLSEAVFHTRLPWWTSVWGWSLVATNMLSLPLMNGVGLFLEEGDHKDYLGLLSFVALSYIVVPFQAYAAIKGFVEHQEGPWFRTPKTGKITDVLARSRFYRFISGWIGTSPKPTWVVNANHYLEPRSSTRFWGGSSITRRSGHWTGRALVATAVLISVCVGLLPTVVPPALATNPSDTKWYLRDQDVGQQDITNSAATGRSIYCVSATDCKMSYYDTTNADLKFRDCDDATCGAGTITTIDSTGDVGMFNSISCPATDDCKIVYYDVTNTAALFYDCDDAICSTGTKTVLDGNTSCSLTSGTGCNTAGVMGRFINIYCVSATDCKMTYSDDTGAHGVARFGDCDDATCSTGSTKEIDGNTGCSLTGCASDRDVTHNSVYCVATDDCKIAYKSSGSSNDLYFGDCDTATCSSGTTTMIDGGTGCALTNCSTTSNTGNQPNVYCLATDDCKVAFKISTTLAIGFGDCDTATCSSGNLQIIDGEVTNYSGLSSCSLTSCSTSIDVQYPSLSCPATDNCKISYRDDTNSDLRFGDCDASSCSSGTSTKADGGSSCTLTNCKTTTRMGRFSSIFCISATNCKIYYYDNTTDAAASGSINNLQFADCTNGTCGAGTTLTVDGNKLINGTLGGVLTQKLNMNSSSFDYVLVSDVAYPSGSNAGTLGSGTYTFKINFTNSLSAGTMTWHYDVGYCTISDNCATKTVHITSANQSYTSATTSPQSPTTVAGSDLSIPGPANSKWIYIEVKTTAAGTGTFNINMNCTSGCGTPGDTYIDVPALTVPEKIVVLIPLGLIIPQVIAKLRRKKRKYATTHS